MKKIIIIFVSIITLLLISWFTFFRDKIEGFQNEKLMLRLNTAQRVIDANANGSIEAAEMENAKERLLLYDHNKNDTLDLVELGGTGTAKFNILEMKVNRALDLDSNYLLDKEELNLAPKSLKTLDQNGNSILDKSELTQTFQPKNQISN